MKTSCLRDKTIDRALWEEKEFSQSVMKGNKNKTNLKHNRWQQLLLLVGWIVTGKGTVAWM